jgi:mono/diheme cytochrome c family protein
VGPGLHGEKNRKDLAAAIAWIENPKLPMPKLYPSVISRKDVEDVAAYVESL